MEWLASKGALIWVPLGHSPDVDLMAEMERRICRVQVKTSTQSAETPNGHRRWRVMIATSGGNQSWSGTTKKFDPAEIDYLFVLVGDGRRWFIPAASIEARRQVALGGSKYAEFEIERGQPIERLIYPDGVTALESRSLAWGSAGAGEPGRPVKSVATLEWVRIPPPPSGPRIGDGQTVPGGAETESEADAPLRFRRTQISSKHQITIPSVPFRKAGLQPGDRLHAWAGGPGCVVFERVSGNRCRANPAPRPAAPSSAR